MWMYEKKLEYPVRVARNDIGMAKFLMAQYGGPDSELSAAVRCMTHRFIMPTNKAKGLLSG